MAMTSARRVFVDTNVLTRATIASAPLHLEAIENLARLRRMDVELWISHQVIREYVANATRPQQYSPPIAIEQVLDQVRRFREQFKLAENTTAVLENLLALIDEFPTGGKQVHDANIVATMLAYGIDTLITHNVEDFRRFESKITIAPLVDERLLGRT